MTAKKRSHRGEERTPAQIEAQERNWMLFQIRGWEAQLTTIGFKGILKPATLEALKAAVKLAQEDVEGQIKGKHHVGK